MSAMNNVRTSIACRVPAAVRPVRKPLLHLFNGYAKFLIPRRPTRRLERSIATFEQQWYPSRAFSTTSYLAVKRTKSKRQPPLAPQTFPRVPKPDSKLEPAPTVASHTEGSHQEEEPLTWRDYDPAGGMPLPNGELSQPQINAVFNSEEVGVDTGNYILCVMHWRRLSGALIDIGLDFPGDSGVDRLMALKGLQYVRTLMPDMDETATGQQWAEEESQRLQEKIQARAVKLGLYQADVKEEEFLEGNQQGTEYGRERTRQSILQKTREANEAEWDQVQAQQAVAKQKDANVTAHAYRGPLELGAGVQPMIQRGDGNTTITTTMPTGVSIQLPKSKAWLQPVERKPWVKYYEEQANIIKENAVPQLSALRRLGPSLLVTVLVLGGCYYLSVNYTAPPTSARLWPETSPAVATLYAVTGVLAASFLLGRLPPLWKFYSKYMVVVTAYPNALSLVGAAFRHDKPLHLASNLASLWLFGLLLHEDVGRGTFLAIYLGSGVLGAYSSLLYHVVRKQWMAYIHGSSGCILGVAAAAVTLRPNGKIRLFGYDIPIAAWVFLALFTGAEAIAVVGNFKTSIDHIGHIGGIATGVVSGSLWKSSIAREEKAGGDVVGLGADKVRQVMRETTLEA